MIPLYANYFSARPAFPPCNSAFLTFLVVVVVVVFNHNYKLPGRLDLSKSEI